jgi:hypothetical protein
MTTINADHYRATTQAVSAAIDLSIAQTEIVTIEADGSHDAVCAELAQECEGSVEDASPAEYWGTNLDGDDWRVHVS